ncbi:MAG TPA: acylphosphatase [Longimicrobium sp.]|jgi:acylphosphatase|nr:acylphosphatase [Longimicrobium sp.]
MAEAGFRVTGRVQGVGFRWWTRAQAIRLGLDGTVRNANDGSVEVEARGPEPALAELERLLNEGPPHARVRAVERFAASLAAHSTGFDVAH